MKESLYWRAKSTIGRDRFHGRRTSRFKRKVRLRPHDAGHPLVDARSRPGRQPADRVQCFQIPSPRKAAPYFIGTYHPDKSSLKEWRDNLATCPLGCPKRARGHSGPGPRGVAQAARVTPAAGPSRCGPFLASRNVASPCCPAPHRASPEPGARPGRDTRAVVPAADVGPGPRDLLPGHPDSRLPGHGVAGAGCAGQDPCVQAEIGGHVLALGAMERGLTADGASVPRLAVRILTVIEECHVPPPARPISLFRACLTFNETLRGAPRQI